MYRHLPPLNALRAFEAAGRHRSFTKAADELFVTQGAVSRQVKKLELHLGAPLFRRDGKRVLPNDLARAILPAASLAFENIDRAFEAASSARSVIRLQVAPTYAVRWPMPRLASFTAGQAGIEVKPSVTLHPEDFDPTSFDAGIIYGDGSWPALSAVLLSEEILVPVLAPDLLAQIGPLHRASDLKGHMLLHTTTDRRDWPLWLTAADARGVDAYSGPAFETLDMAVRAAEASLGVTLADISLIGAEIEAGKLVAPIEQPLRSGRGTYFVCPKESRNQEALAAFRDWLLADAPVNQKSDDSSKASRPMPER